MAEEIQKKKISELPSAVYLSDEDVMPVVQSSGSSEATKKVDIGLVGSTVAESKTFSNLDTTSKTLVGAINEVNSSLGNVPSADEISYDNTSSGLSASDVQGAIDEIAQGGSGGSTVTVTQVQTTGTKIATITVDSVGTDLYAPNGGGGASAFEDLTDVDIDSSTLANGQVPVYNSTSAKWENGTISGGSGHTILNDEGTSLTQRDDLQFKGAYSEDDSTNEKTVVNVVREMTKAEFDELTEAEKTGLINITDVTGGNDDRFQPVIYSEDEREIGVYTDGKPLYEKTIYSATVTDATEVAHNIANIDKVAEVKCNIMRYGSWNSGNFIFENNNHFSVVVSKTAYYCVFVPATGVYSNLYLTIRYTKSTDQAGSGQWTPQGVPAVHYSEDEQVIGTWIDGSTLYEKTIDFGALPNTTTKTVNHNISNIATICDIEGIAFNSSTDTAINLPYPNTDNTNVVTISANQTVITIITYRDRTLFNGYVTIRYTKSST